MNFAIVLFTDEGDAPGIIATNWLDSSKKLCRYPNVKTEVKRTKLLLAKAMPEKDWLQCFVRVLKEFENYETARALLAKSEDTSNLDSDDDTLKKRKRKFKHIHLPGEESSTEEEGELESPSIITEDIEPYPDPPLPSKKVKRFSKESKESKCHDQGNRNEETSEIKKIKHTMWTFMNEVTASIKQLENTMNVILSEVKEIKSKMGEHMELSDKICKVGADENDEFCIMSSMPVGIDGFDILNEKMASNYSFRQRVKKSFMTCGGKDCKSLTSTLLKKLLTDDVAENFSLTGRSKTGGMKKSFENTETYKLIIEIVCRKYSGAKENSVREAICEWLIQSKHRKERREKKNVNRKQEEDRPPLPADSDSLTFRDIV